MTYKERQILDYFFIKLYGINNRYLRKIIREILFRRKFSEFYSKTLRTIFSKYHNIKVGLYSYGAFNLSLPAGLRVGRYTSIANDLTVINGSHPVSTMSTHPFFYNPYFNYVNILLIKRREKLIIGNDVYIGSKVTILPKVTYIGDGAVIAAGSVVIKDVPPYAIVGGVPAHIISYRFGKNTIKNIINSKWWDKDIEEISNNNLEFSNFLKPLK